MRLYRVPMVVLIEAPSSEAISEVLRRSCSFELSQCPAGAIVDWQIDASVIEEQEAETLDRRGVVPEAQIGMRLPWGRIVVMALLGALIVLVARDLLDTVFAWIGLGVR